MHDGGNFNLTKVTLHEDSSTTHVTTIEHDYRGRALLVEAPEAPHLFAKLDSLGRTVAIGEYSDVSSISITSNDPTTTTTNRVGLREASYDELGRVWRTKLHDIEQPSSGVSGGTSLSSLESLYWYDSMSRLRKTTGQSYAKYSYDSLGRMTRTYLLAGDNDSTYADALDASGDVVVEERQSSFGEGSDYLAFSLNIDRFHDSGSASPLGPLDTDSGSPATPNLVELSHLVGRATATGYTYDDHGRLKTRTFVGVPDSSDFSSGFNWDHDDAAASNPSAGLETTVGYTDRGHQETVTDPMGRVSKREVDALGRTVATYANYKDGVLDAIDLANDPGSAGGTDHWDDDQKVSYTYTDGLLATIKAHDPSNEVDDPDQLTTYSYGTAVSGAGPLSDVATGHLLSEVEYPDSTGSSDVVSMSYNRFGQVIWNKDQAGNVLERDIDGLGRTTALRATTIATGFDDRVKRIEREYDERGGLSLITQYSAATGGSVLDQVAIDRFGHGGIRTMEQDVDSAISGGSGIVPKTLTYRYELSTGGRSSFRRTKQFLPSDREFSFSYSSGIDDELSRVSIVMDDRRRVTSYKYLGADRVVGTNYGVPDVNSNLFGSTSGSYPGLDAYNRVVNFKWTKALSTDSFDFYNVSLTLDDNSNPELILDNVIETWDVEAEHDELNRITSFEEGDWNGSGFSATRSNESWDYDQIGNWVNFDSDWGGLSPAITESRESGNANEIETRDTDDDGTTDETLVYDAVGNLTSTGTHSYVYDVWGRQVEVSLGGTGSGTQTLMAEYEYNGLGYRVREHTDIDESGTLDSSDEWLSHVYDEDWRIVATYRGSDLADSAKAEYLFHAAGYDGRGGSSYINSAIARWRDAEDNGWDASSDGVLEEEHYYCANHRGDTVAILDDSGRTVEWVRYSAYGVPFGIPVADITLNGLLGNADLIAMQAIIDASGYSVIADANLDGVVDGADKTYATDMFNAGATGGYSVISAYGHRSGYAGMDYQGSTQYIARNRVLVAGMGVWGRRDPLGYIDGSNFQSFLSGNPLSKRDPMGLEAIPSTSTLEGLKVFKVVLAYSYGDPTNLTSALGHASLISGGRRVDFYPDAGHEGESRWATFRRFAYARGQIRVRPVARMDWHRYHAMWLSGHQYALLTFNIRCDRRAGNVNYNVFFNNCVSYLCKLLRRSGVDTGSFGCWGPFRLPEWLEDGSDLNWESTKKPGSPVGTMPIEEALEQVKRFAKGTIKALPGKVYGYIKGKLK